MSAPVGLEIFAGCGGMSTGFLDAGINIAAGYDIDAPSIECYEYNHAYRGSHGYLCDLQNASGESLLATAGILRADLIVGGPPCQPFSIAGKRRGRLDHRATLIDTFARIVEEIEPQAIFFENVPNLVTIEGGSIFKRLISRLQDLRYSVDWNVVSASEYGVPQNRRRLLLVAARGMSRIKLPPATHGEMTLTGLLPLMTAKDALDDLPDAGDFGECGIYNHERTEHTDNMLSRFRQLQVGRRDRASFHDRLHPNRPSYTLRAGTGNFSPLRPVHYRYDRVVTARESARLQSFADEFIWPDSIPRLQQYRQVGNAVPPLLAKAVGASLAAQLGWKALAGSLAGDPNCRASAITLTDEERKLRRLSRIRGASLGKQLA